LSGPGEKDRPERCASFGTSPFGLAVTGFGPAVFCGQPSSMVLTAIRLNTDALPREDPVM